MSTIITAVDSKEPDRLFASTVRELRRSLGATVAQLARVSGIACRSIEAIEAIEAGGATTRAERHDNLGGVGLSRCCSGPLVAPVLCV